MSQVSLDFGNDSNKESEEKKDRKFCQHCGNRNTMVEQHEVEDGYIKYLCNNCYFVEYHKKDDR